MRTPGVGVTDALLSDSLPQRRSGKSSGLRSSVHSTGGRAGAGDAIDASLPEHRRADASAWAGRLGDDLMTRFGRDAVFQDVVAIVAGESFPAAIEAALAQADVVLAVIGPRWLNDGSAEVSRLADPICRGDSSAPRSTAARLARHGHGSSCAFCPDARRTSPEVARAWSCGQRHNGIACRSGGGSNLSIDRFLGRNTPCSLSEVVVGQSPRSWVPA